MRTETIDCPCGETADTFRDQYVAQFAYASCEHCGRCAAYDAGLGLDPLATPAPLTKALEAATPDA